ncbi:MAG: UbiH/UbiF/VisC/COQ6 family ubiquinone biosynthesis hydroxylase [Rhodospirillales bacterium]|jgi:2-octaprenyl-6-methoxyphenol hydroxylase
MAQGQNLAARVSADAIIVGGGLVGGALAQSLAGLGLHVAVVDRGNPQDWLDGRFDGRASAVALASQRFLDAIGLWSAMASEACAIEDIRVSEAKQPFFLHYDHRELGDVPFGYMVENRHIRKALYGTLNKNSNVEFHAPATIEKISRNSGQASVTLKSGITIEAPLLIAADGRRSRIRAEAGIRVTQWQYKQTGIVCTVKHEKPHHNIAHEHFLPVGPFAILPLRGDRSSLVWVESDVTAPAIMQLDDDAFLAELKKRFGDFLGGVSVIGPRWSFPLSLQHAHRYVDNRLALIGDAAHGMHPIAGQGLNLGWRGAAALTEVIYDARQLGLDYGLEPVLEKYERWRRFDNTLMLAMTDGLNRLFSNNLQPLKLARDAGLAIVNKLPPLKKIFMGSAMGLAGDVPKLMRGESLRARG